MNKMKYFIVLLTFILILILSNYLVFKVQEYQLRTSDSVKLPLKVKFKQLFHFGLKNTFPKGIPRIIHYNYASRMVPPQYVPLAQDCIRLNPGVKFVLWTDSSAYNLMETYFPSKFDMYRSYISHTSDPLKKADIIRYFILRQFGGIYIDFDTRCQKPMEVAMQNDSCILSSDARVQTRILFNKDFQAMNSFMACVSNHEFFIILSNKLQRDANIQILENTGPLFLTDVFIKYNITLNGTDHLDPHKYVSLSSSDTFSPHIEGHLGAYCKYPGGKWKKLGCKDLAQYRSTLNEKIQNAVVVHLFYHLGYPRERATIKSLLDIGNATTMTIFD